MGAERRHGASWDVSRGAHHSSWGGFSDPGELHLGPLPAIVFFLGRVTVRVPLLPFERLLESRVLLVLFALSSSGFPSGFVPISDPA